MKSINKIRMLKRFNLVMFLLLLCSFVNAINVDILSPTIGQEVPTFVDLDFSVDERIKYCTYNIDGGDEIKSVSYPKLELYDLIEGNATHSLNGISALKLYNDNLYVAGNDAFYKFSMSNPASKSFITDEDFYYNSGSQPSRIMCHSGSMCVITFYADSHFQTYGLNMAHIRWYDAGNPIYDMYGDSWIFMAVTGSDKILSVELSDEDQFYYDSTFSGVGSPNYLDGVRGITMDRLYGDYVFYASANDDAIGSASIHYSDPNVYLTLEDVYNPGIDEMEGIEDVFYYENFIYGISSSAQSVVVLNATDRTDLNFAYSMESTDYSLGYSSQIEVFDDIFFIDDVYNNEIDYYDASSPYDGMTYYGSTYTTETAYNYNLIDSLKDFQVEDYILYTANDYLDEIGIFTIYRPINITISDLELGWHNITLTCKGVDDTIDSDITGFNVFTYDGDADGINDSDDNCPDDYNPGQEDVDYLIVPLTDEGNYYWLRSYYYNVSDFKISDGGDACDSCPDTYDYDCLYFCGTDFEVWGHPDADFDNIGDACDNCVNTWNENQNDADGDLIGNECDNCFLVSNNNQTNYDNDTYGDVCDICILNDDHTDYNGDGYADCLGGNCNNSILDLDIGETEIDYGGACGTCIDGITNGNYTASPELSPDIGGRCGYCYDNILNGEEDVIDYGGHCGTCIDGLLSPLLNETEIDYGGKCGSCDNTTAEDDLYWSVSDKIFPVIDNDLYCESGEYTIWGFSIFAFFLIIIFFGGIIVAFIIPLFFLIIFIRGIFGRKKENFK